MSDKLDAQISISADASGVEAGVGRAKRSLSSLGAEAKGIAAKMGESGKAAGAGIEAIGAGGEKAAQKVAKETRNMERSLQVLLAKMEGGSRESRVYWERMADFRGADKNALRPLLQQLDQLKAKQAAAAGGMTELSDSTASMGASMALAVRGVQTLLGLQVVGWAKEGAAALFEASAAAERLRIGLDFASVRGSADEIAYLRKTTDGLGLSFASTAQSYMQFQAAAKGTALEGSKARDVFESVAKASAVMGLSAEQNSGVLLALQQMVSKGTVQAEELRGQLGERLPGAFQIAARSMGVTTAELGKMLEMGQVISDDFLPKFAAELERSLGGAAENAANRLDAAVNRFDNAWERLKQKVGDSGVSKAMASEMTALSRDVITVTETIERASAEGAGALSSLSQGALVAAGRAGFASLNLAANTLNGSINLLTGDILGLNTNLAVLPDALKTNAEQAKTLGVEMEAAQAKLKRLQELDAMPSNGNYYKTAIQDADAYIEKLREALKLRGVLAGVSTPVIGGDPLNDGTQYGTYLEKQKKFDAAQAGLLELSARTNGINKQFTADLQTYADALDAGAMSAGEYAKAVTDLNAKRYESTEAGKAEAKALRDSERGAKGAQTTYANLAQSVSEYVAQLTVQSEQGRKVSTAQKLQIQLDELLIKGKGKVAAATVANIQASIAIAKAMEVEVRAVKTAQDAYQDYLALQDELAADYVSQSKAREAVWKSIGAGNLALDEQEKRLSIEEQMIGRSSAARDIALAKLEAEIELRNELNAIDSNLDLDEPTRDEARAAARARSVRKIALAERKAYVSEWEKTSQLIGDTLADYIMSGGQDAATYLKRLFSTLVLQPVVQAGVSGAMQSLGVGGAPAGGAGLGNVASMLQNGHSLYGAVTGSLTYGLGSAIAGMGATLGSTAATSFGAGMAASGFTTGAFGTGASMVGAGATSTGLGMMAGAALPWVAGGLAVISLLGDLFGSSRPQSARLGGAYSTAGLNDYQVSSALGLNKDFKKAVESRSNAALDTAVQSLVMSVTGAYNSLGKYTGGKKLGATAAFADEPNLDDRYSWAAFQLFDELTGKVLASWNSGKALDPDGEKAFAVLSGQMSAAMVAELKSADIPGWMRQVLDSLGSAITLDGLSGAMQQIAVIDAAFEGWKDSVVGFDKLNGVVQTTLLNVSGGLEVLATNVSGYYQNFYSEQERAAVTTRQLTQALAAYGVALPSSKEDFRELIEQQLAAGDAGAELAAVLLGMQGIFASVASTWATELDGMAKEVADFFGAVHESIAGVTADVQATRQSILRGNGAMTASEIQAAITAAMVQAPSTAASIAAQGGVATAAGTVAMQQTQSNTAAAKVTATQELLSKAQAERDAYAASMNAVRSSLAVNQDQLDSYIDGKRSHYGSRRTNIGYFSGQVQYDQARLAAMQPQFDAYNAAVAAQQAALDAATASAKTNADALAAAKTALDAAQKAQADALTAYASEVAKYVGDASTSVGKLSELRSEVESFYAAQEQAVQAMLQSAGNIRNVADQVRLSQLTNAQTAQELGARYAMDYSMALATTGSTRAGYVDSMAGNLQSLSNAMKVEASSSAEWQISVGKLLAQASNAANLLDGDAKNDDYQDVALGLLDSIDTALEGLSTATKSAEQVIADAIAAGTQAQLEGLRAIVAALTGQSIPGFAVGTNYVTQDMTARIHQGEAIIPKAFNPWAGGRMPMGGGDSAAVVDAVRELQADQRAQASTTVRLQQDLNRLLMRWETQGMPEERQENA